MKKQAITNFIRRGKKKLRRHRKSENKHRSSKKYRGQGR
jgi:hypothetical protein